jgi:hypothetical protein
MPLHPARVRGRAQRWGAQAPRLTRLNRGKQLPACLPACPPAGRPAGPPAVPLASAPAATAMLTLKLRPWLCHAELPAFPQECPGQKGNADVEMGMRPHQAAAMGGLAAAGTKAHAAADGAKEQGMAAQAAPVLPLAAPLSTAASVAAADGEGAAVGAGHAEPKPDMSADELSSMRQLQLPGNGGPTADASGGGSEELYYSSVPAALGRQLQQQLRRELTACGSRDVAGASHAAAAATSSAAEAGSAQPQAAATTAAVDELYYSSMPAAVGRSMQAQLRQQLRQAGQQLAAGEAATQSVSTLPAPAAGQVQPAAGYYSSVPAAVGRQLGEQLRQEMAAMAAATSAAGAAAPAGASTSRRQASASPSVVAGAGVPAPAAAAALPKTSRLDQQEQRPQQPGRTEQPVWEDYHRTVSGAAGTMDGALLLVVCVRVSAPSLHLSPQPSSI